MTEPLSAPEGPASQVEGAADRDPMTIAAARLAQLEPPAPDPDHADAVRTAALDAFRTAQAKKTDPALARLVAGLRPRIEQTLTRVAHRLVRRPDMTRHPRLDWRLGASFASLVLAAGLATGLYLSIGQDQFVPTGVERADATDDAVETDAPTTSAAKIATGDAATGGQTAPVAPGGPPAEAEGGAPSVAPPPPSPAPAPSTVYRGVHAESPGRSGARGLAIGAIDQMPAPPRLAAQAPPAGVAPPAAAPANDLAPTPPSDPGRERFTAFEDQPVRVTAEQPVSTFSIDVDTASYAYVRRALTDGHLPQADAVRTEELVNYFTYDRPQPETRDRPFALSATALPSPWAEGRSLLVLGVQGYQLPPGERPRLKLTLLVDVSGSMQSPDKLGLLKRALRMLVTSGLDPDDTIALAVYAGAAGAVLPPTPVRERTTVLGAIDRLEAGGSTAGGAGLRLAYSLAEQAFDADAVNRVMIATDGDFNVGIRSRAELTSFITRKRATGIYLSVLGVGRGNYNDALMQALAQTGNGTAAYLDSLAEAQRVLVDHASRSLVPIAKDVKIQVEFNPAAVAEWRLIGYETRTLRREDFRNDAVDAGEVGSGSTVTALYEIVPAGGDARQIPPRRYGPTASAPTTDPSADEIAFLRLRYKLPDSDTSRLIERPITAGDAVDSIAAAPADARFAAAVAAFGQVLRGVRLTGRFGFAEIAALAQGARGDDPDGTRAGFVQLVRLANSAAAMRQP